MFPEMLLPHGYRWYKRQSHGDMTAFRARGHVQSKDAFPALTKARIQALDNGSSTGRVREEWTAVVPAETNDGVWVRRGVGELVLIHRH